MWTFCAICIRKFGHFWVNFGFLVSYFLVTTIVVERNSYLNLNVNKSIPKSLIKSLPSKNTGNYSERFLSIEKNTTFLTKKKKNVWIMCKGVCEGFSVESLT